MRTLVAAMVLVLVSTGGLGAAPQTWTGKISDSMCGASHNAMKEHDKKLTDKGCTEACVKGGAKYVFASGGKVYTIENQNDPQLAAHAGEIVRLTGEMKGNSITVSNIAVPAKARK